MRGCADRGTGVKPLIEEGPKPAAVGFGPCIGPLRKPLPPEKTGCAETAVNL